MDPQVSRSKFDREIAAFRELADVHRKRGWFITKAEFPIVEVLFVTPNFPLRLVGFAARIDFTDYDLLPPSVALIDPIDGVPLAKEALRTPLPRTNPDGTHSELAQGFPGMPAFLCMPGVREYHGNPAHTGDSWFLHRGRGAGTLYYLCDHISHCGSEPIVGLQPMGFLIQLALKP